MGHDLFKRIEFTDLVRLMPRWIDVGHTTKDIKWHLADPMRVVDMMDVALGWRSVGDFTPIKQSTSGTTDIENVDVGILHELEVIFKKHGFSSDMMRWYLAFGMLLPAVRACLRDEADRPPPPLVVDTDSLKSAIVPNRGPTWHDSVGQVPLSATSFQLVRLRNRKFQAHIRDEPYRSYNAISQGVMYGRLVLAESLLSHWCERNRHRNVNVIVADALMEHDIFPRNWTGQIVFPGTRMHIPGYNTCFRKLTQKRHARNKKRWHNETIMRHEALPAWAHNETTGAVRKRNFDVSMVCLAPKLVQQRSD